MWLLTGPFIGPGVENGQVSYVLSPGSSVTIGRKGCDYNVDHRGVSHTACSLTVAAVSLKDAENPNHRPTLTVRNVREAKEGKDGKEKNDTKVVRHGDGEEGMEENFIVSPQSELDLEDNDEVMLSSKASIWIYWKPVCCYIPGGRNRPVALKKTASLGICTTPVPAEDMTHHITPTQNATPLMANSLLLSCHFVTADFLTELVKVAEDKTSPFQVPNPSLFRPEYADTLRPEQRNAKTWQPNEARMKMFKNYSFVFVGEQGREVSTEVKDLVGKTGGGQVQTFNVHDGTAKLAKLLVWNRAKANKKVALVADTEALPVALGKDAWTKMVADLRKQEFEFITVADIIQTVIDIDYTHLTQTTGAAAEVDELPPASFPMQGVQSTYSEEHSQQESSRPRTRRATSRQASQEPESSQPAPKRTLRRAVSRADSQEPDDMDVDAAAGGRGAGRRGTLRRAVSRQASQEPEPIIPDEPPASSSRRPLKRVTSRQPSQEPEEQSKEKGEGAESKPKAKLLIRRIKDDGNPIVTGFEDPDDLFMTLGLDSVPAPVVVAPASVEPSAPPSRTTSRARLKRRADEAVDESDDLFSFARVKPEPPWKKHKDLFDATNPDNPNADGETMETLFEQAGINISQTQGDSQDGESGVRSSKRGLAVVREEEEEEEEESQATTTTGTGTGIGSSRSRGVKRKGTEDVEMASVEQALLPTPTPSDSRAQSLAPPAKKRAIEDLNAVTRTDTIPGQASGPAPISPPKKTKKPGAEPGKPDTDAAFLKALASTKRGKKAEDEFDREFNNLKISKPMNVKEVKEEETEERWRTVLAYNPDEWTSRGNFMVVVEMDVPRRERRENEYREEWEGVPNFKKFRKVKAKGDGSKVELVKFKQQDYGIGVSYWRTSSQSQKHRSSQFTQPRARSPVVVELQAKPQAPEEEEEDDFDDIRPLTGKGKGKGKVSSRASSAAPGNQPPLFLPDEDSQMDDIDSVETLKSSVPFTPTLAASGTTRPKAKAAAKKSPKTKGKKRKMRFADEDSDDGVFGGFGGGGGGGDGEDGEESEPAPVVRRPKRARK